MHRRSRSNISATLALALAAGAAGCERWGVTESDRLLQQQFDQSQLELRQCHDALAERDARLDVLHQRINRDRPFQHVDLDDLFVVDRIEIVSRSGGVDLDKQPGDDGVVVYVRTLDADGDVLKAAGEFVIQLFDLTQPGQPRELGVFSFDDSQSLRKSWYGGFLTNHYTFQCPFNAGQMPSTREVQVRVTFLDWLTGRSFSDSKTVTIKRIDAPASATTQPRSAAD